MENPYELILSRLDILEQQGTLILSRLNTEASFNNTAQLLAEMPEQLRSRDIKKLFAISAVTIWKWERKNILKPQFISGRKFYSKKDVLKLLNEKSKH